MPQFSQETLEAFRTALRNGGGVVSRTEHGGSAGRDFNRERELHDRRLITDATSKATQILNEGGTPVLLHLLDYEMDYLHPTG